MIARDYKNYDYFLLKENSYAEMVLTEKPIGKIKMVVYLRSQQPTDNIKYSEAQYIGLTYAPIDDNYIIQVGENKLKVLYVNKAGNLKQVFLSDY